MSWLKKLFGGSDWDDEPRNEQTETLTRDPMVLMGIVMGTIPRLGPDCDTVPGAHGAFGRDATNPIPVNGPHGEIHYLNRLRAPSGVGFFYHRVGTAEAPNSETPLDEYELLAVDGTYRVNLFFAPYHPRRSQLVPEGMSRTSWTALDRMHRLMIKVPGFGTNQRVADFPWGLPDAIRVEPSLRQISPTLGDTMARKASEMLASLRRS